MIFENALGKFIPNHPPKHAITSTNNAKHEDIAHNIIKIGLKCKNYGVVISFILVKKSLFKRIKDTHKEKALSNKTLALTESMNMDIWVVDT